MVYALVGKSLPAPWTHKGYDFDRLVGHLYQTLEGIYGATVDVSSSLIILFTIFGAVLQYSGAGKFFIDFSFAAMGGKHNSAGRAVVLSSFLMGGPSGSGVATTVTIGTVAYPLLKRSGYERNAAGGLLAAGGLGAIISPPVLGAAAFLIAEYLKISYLDVIWMAMIPTILYYFAILIMVEIDARKHGSAAGGEVLVAKGELWRVTKTYWYHFSSLISIIVFMLLGGMSFVRFVQLGAGDPRPLLQDSQIRAFLGVYLVLCLGLILARLDNGETIDELALREIFFSMASVITTTGFANADYGTWGPLAATLFFCAMMVCGCSGSTSGGPKIFRYQLLVSAVTVEIGALNSPNAVALPRYQGRTITPDVMNSVVGFFMLFFLTLGIGAVALVLIGLDPVTAISGAAAALTNVGPGFGPHIGPVGNYAGLSDAAIWVTIIPMFVGRLELLTVYVIFTAAYWRG